MLELNENMEQKQELNLNNLEKCNINKKCNFYQIKAKNEANICKNGKNYDEKLLSIAYKSELNIYIKVLLEAYKSLPNIINIIDRIIEKRASSIMPVTTIYGSNYFNTFSEMNKVIDLTDRKDKLLNLFVIIENLLDSLNDNDRKIAVLKFVQKNTTEEIAKEMKTTDRTIYRRTNKIIEKLAIYMLKQNWTSEFLKSQIGNEPWIKELFNKKKISENVINKTFKR